MRKFLWLWVLLVAASCAGGRKLALVKEGGAAVDVAVGSLDDVRDDIAEDAPQVAEVVEVEDLKGNRIIMNAVKDEETGEMVAQEHLNEIVVQARFSHVAERNGMVDLVFELAVPQELQHRMWQVRLYPKYAFLGDTLKGDEIHITGERFRKVQNWEYRMYGNYLSRIIPDSVAQALYARDRQMKNFIARNGHASGAGKHYRKALLESMNRNKGAAKGEIYERFVVDPFPEGGVRLDSVVNAGNGVIRYFYVQTIAARAGLRRVDMVLEGSVHTNGRKLCSLEAAEPLTFYISSISTLADDTERYLKKVVYRDMHFDAAYNIEFAKGAWKIDPGLGDNAAVLCNMKRNLVEIVENEDFVMDSILVAAACSPEGSFVLNEKLSRRRGEEIKVYLLECMDYFRDSVAGSVWEIKEAGGDGASGYDDVEASDGDDSEVPGSVSKDKGFVRVTGLSEDWEGLYGLIAADTVLKDTALVARCSGVDDPDARERVLLQGVYAGYIRNELYPKLRRVKFSFKLHRKGMIKDTVHTTELDTVYMRGVEALKNRDYKLAVTLLRPYGCYNSAVAYMCMGYDNSALEILRQLPRDARRDYMLAVVYGRLGDEKRAVEHYLNSVEQDQGMRHRGNLDPEISALIKKYGIFNNF